MAAEVEQLEDRPRAVTHQRERLGLHGLAGVGVQAVGAVGRHRDDRVAVLARPDHAHHAGDAVEIGRGEVVDRRLHRILDVGVQGGLDEVAALGDLFLADARAGEIVEHVVAEEGAVAGGDASARQFVGLRKYAERLQLRRAERLGLLRHVVDHGVQHHVSTFQGALGVGIRIQRARRLHHAGEEGGLLPVQLGGVDPEVGLRGVLHAERAVSERHQVEVARQYLRLGEGLVQRQRHADLAQLAGGRGFDRGALLGVGLRDHQQLVVLHVLLLEGGAAAGVGRPGDVSGQAGQRALPVDAVVLGKSLVLDGDDRQLHGVGDLVARHFESSLGVQPRKWVALGVHHGRHRGYFALDQLGGAVGYHVGGTVGHQPEAADHRKHQTCGDDAGEQNAPGELDDGDRGWHAPRWRRRLRSVGHGYRVARPIATSIAAVLLTPGAGSSQPQNTRKHVSRHGRPIKS